jgi:hypothetical protein
MTRMIQTWTAAAVLLVLPGCASLGVPTAQTFDERVVAGYQIVTGMAESTGMLLDANKIEAKDGRNIHTQLTTLKESIDVAVSLKAAGDFSSAETRLDAAIHALKLLQGYLALREAGNGS